MFQNENEGEDAYSYEEWLHDAYHDQERAGFAAWVLIALCLVVGAAGAFITYELLPPGRYPRFLIAIPMALALVLTWHLAGGLVYALFVKGRPRPVPPSNEEDAAQHTAMMDSPVDRPQAPGPNGGGASPVSPEPRSAPSAESPPVLARAPASGGPPRAAVVVTVLVAMLGVVATLLAMLADARTTLHVLAVGDQGVEVTVNGQTLQPLQSQGRHFQFQLGHGPHDLSLRDPTLDGPHQLIVDVRSVSKHVVLSVYPGLCLVRLNVAPFLYPPAGPDDEVLPRRERLHLKAQVSELEHYGDASMLLSVPASTHFQVDTLPAQLPQGESLFLMVQVPCRYAQAPAPAFVSAGLLTPGLGRILGLKPEDLETVLQEEDAGAASSIP